MKLSQHATGLGLSLAVSLLASSTALAALKEFRPHRAVYDLSLAETSDRANIRSVRGRIVYELTGSACEGYAARYRYKTNVDVGRRILDNDQQSTVFESADGDRFDFATRYFLNGQEEQNLRGTALKGEEGLMINIAKPAEREVSLEPAIFMNEHMAKIIAAAKAGETIVTATVYDGSDQGDELLDTTAIIGKARPGGQAFEDEGDGVADKYATLPGWPVTISYFNRSEPDNAGEKLPTYRVSFLMHPDGVSRNLTMSYEDYSLKGDLKELEFLPQDACE